LLCYRLTHLCILYMSKHFGMANTKNILQDLLQTHSKNQLRNKWFHKTNITLKIQVFWDLISFRLEKSCVLPIIKSRLPHRKDQLRIYKTNKTGKKLWLKSMNSDSVVRRKASSIGKWNTKRIAANSKVTHSAGHKVPTYKFKVICHHSVYQSVTLDTECGNQKLQPLCRPTHTRRLPAVWAQHSSLSFYRPIFGSERPVCVIEEIKGARP
jgi:hypothetical protein